LRAFRVSAAIRAGRVVPLRGSRRAIRWAKRPLTRLVRETHPLPDEVVVAALTLGRFAEPKAEVADLIERAADATERSVERDPDLG
jgi:hypothetical protein